MTLPEMGKPFIGRQRKLDELIELLGQRGRPLITVTGFGGFGKTTLAMEAARRVAGEFEHGIAFVPLAAVRDPRNVPSHVARTLGLIETTGVLTPEQALIEYLAERELLLILDNFEHVLDAKLLVSQLLAACPNLVVLVTSRRELRLGAERVIDLDPMIVPAASEGITADEALGSEAVLLFRERAKAMRADFEVDDRNARDVAEICRTLEGIPLAIELAAARTRAVGTRDLLRLLRPRLGIASAGPADSDPRHQALGEMIAWSYELLTPSQQRLFQRLCVFADGFSLEAAEWVVGAGGWGLGAGDDGGIGNRDSGLGIGTAGTNSALGPQSSVPIPYPPSPTSAQQLLDDLAELDANHLIRFRRLPDGSSRYEMLETIIEFGLRRLEEACDTEAARWAHAAYCLDLAQRAEHGLRTGEAPQWLETLELELSNLRAAIRWLLDHAGDGCAALRLCNALWSFWRLRGSWVEAIRWLEAAIAVAGEAPSKPQAIAWLYLGNSIFDDQRRAQRCYEQSLRLFEALGDAGGIAVAIGSLAMLADMMGEYERGKELSASALARLRALPQDVRSSIGMALIVTADLELNSGHPARARPLLAEALAIWQELADEQHVAVALWRLGRVERLVGHPHEAGEFLTQALDSLRKTFDRNLEYMVLSDLGLARLAAGRYDDALATFAASLGIAQELQVSDGTVAGTLEGLARLRMQLGHVDEGVRIFGAADRLRQRTATPVPQVEREQYRRELKAARQKLRTSYESHWTIGQTLSFEQAQALALAPVAGAAWVPRPAVKATAQPVAGLTEREHEVLCELVKGKSDREIGESLGIQVSTARTLVQRVREKLAVSSRNAAATKAIEAGWCIE